MRKELLIAGFSPDLIRQMGTEILYRGYVATKSPGILEQMGLLKCDADSQSPEGALEDLKDLKNI